MSFKPIKVKLYGESFKIHQLELNDEILDAAKRLQEPIEIMLLNASFFNILNLKNCQSLDDLIYSSFGGLMNTNKNQIEIKKGRKCLQKIHLNCLFYPDTLFPLFNVNKKDLIITLKDHLFLIEKEVGLIAEYKIDVEKFDISSLTFSLADLKFSNDHCQLLDSLRYKKTKLQSLKSDCLITHRHCINKLNKN